MARRTTRSSSKVFTITGVTLGGEDGTIFIPVVVHVRASSVDEARRKWNERLSMEPETGGEGGGMHDVGLGVIFDGLIQPANVHGSGAPEPLHYDIDL